MAQVNEMLTFKFRAFDLDGLEIDADVRGRVIDPKGVTTDVIFTRVSTGLYSGTYVCMREGDHWIRVEATGTIRAAVEKKFNVAKSEVVIDDA